MKCQACGKAMTGRKRKYCDAKCGRRPHVQQCEVCGDKYRTAYRTQKTCGKQECVSSVLSEVRRAASKWEWRVGDSKLCEVCNRTFIVKSERHCRTCSRKCGAALRLKEGTNGTHGSEEDRKKMRACRQVKAVVRKAQVQVKNTLRPCQSGLCGNRGVSQHGRWCKQCQVAFRWLTCGVSGYRTTWCQHCKEVKSRVKGTTTFMTCGKCKRKQRAAQKAKRRALKRGATRCDNDIDLDTLDLRDGGICHICKGIVDWEASPLSNRYGSIDHVVPLAKGGTHTWDNVKLAHRLCNSRKGASEGVTPKKL